MKKRVIQLLCAFAAFFLVVSSAFAQAPTSYSREAQSGPSLSVRLRTATGAAAPLVEDPGDAFGYGGLGPNAPGWGGGGTGEGTIGMGGIGTLGQPSTPPVHDTGRGLRARGATGPTLRLFDVAEWIRGTVRANLPSLTSCHARFLATRPEREGSLRVRFRILSDGRVANVAITEIDPRLQQIRFQRCVTQAITAWRFIPRGDRVVTDVTYPFLFTPSQASPPGRRAT